MVRKKEKRGEKKILYAQDKQKRLLEKLGFVQLVFDFYTRPVAYIGIDTRSHHR